MRIVLFALVILAACNKSPSPNPTPPQNPPAADTPIIKGADVSWVTQMEASGYKFYNGSGAQQECMQLLQGLGMNSIRLRVWVNPSDGWCGLKDLITKATRAKALGLRIMIDFHYSDTWADPAHQTKPASWTGLDFPTLSNTVYSYTQTVLDSLETHGVVPSWVQLGNETDNGMLWPDAQASANMANFATLVSSGYRAVKALHDSVKVIVHISNGWNNSLFRWMFDGLQTNNAQYDIIGMSMYPAVANWGSYNDSCFTNMKDMVSRYNKPVMICEVGMPADQPTACQAFLTDLIHKVKAVPGGKGLGVFYWEPEAYNWQGYGLGAFDNSGKPTAALNAFHN